MQEPDLREEMALCAQGYRHIAGLDEAGLALFYRRDGEWVREPTSQVDVVANAVTAQPDHFSLWAILSDERRVYLPAILRGGP